MKGKHRNVKIQNSHDFNSINIRSRSSTKDEHYTTAETSIYCIIIPDSSTIGSNGEGPESPLEREPAIFGFEGEVDGEGEGELNIEENAEGGTEAVTEGEADGERERKVEGETEGVTEGEAEGVKGDAEGGTEGKADGERERKVEGETEGETEAVTEGEADGERERKVEGVKEGEADGDAEGDADGLDVVLKGQIGLWQVMGNPQDPIFTAPYVVYVSI